MMAAFDTHPERENNLCQVAGCGVNALSGILSSVVDLISEAHQATVSEFNAHLA